MFETRYEIGISWSKLCSFKLFLVKYLLYSQCTFILWNYIESNISFTDNNITELSMHYNFFLIHRLINNCFIIIHISEELNLYAPGCKLQHASGQKFQCLQCGKVYQHKFNLNKHQKYECQNRRLFSCQHCSYSANQKVHLKRHLATVHHSLIDISKDFL